MPSVHKLAAEPALDRCCALGEFGRPAGVAQLVERQLPKLKVAGSRPVARFRREVEVLLPFLAPCEPRRELIGSGQEWYTLMQYQLLQDPWANVKSEGRRLTNRPRQS
jgi:hypothetical protein